MDKLLNYQKNRREGILTELEDSTLGVSLSQNYIPIYKRFFNMDDTNYNSLNLNNVLRLQSLGDELRFRTYDAFPAALSVPEGGLVSLRRLAISSLDSHQESQHQRPT